MDADDLNAAGDTAWWLGDVEGSNRRWEEAFRLFEQDGRSGEAALAAANIAINHFLRGEENLGAGWLQRASRFVEGDSDTLAFGYISYILDVEANWRSSSPADVTQAASRVRRIGRRYGDTTLVAAALNGEGRLRIERGEVAEGLALVDESMISVVAGEVTPEWAGNLYCNTIAVCHRLGDLPRMSQWTSATEEWLETISVAVLFSGICRVHRAQLLGVKGEWDRSETEAQRVVVELAGISVANVAEAWYQIGELRRLRGDLAEAEVAYRHAHANGRLPHPGLALLRLREGRKEAASTAIRSALVATADPLARAALCSAQVEIAIAAAELEDARKAAEELSDIAAAYSSPGLGAMAVTALGSVALAESYSEEALPLLREASTRWRDLEAPYETARSCVLLAHAYRALGDAEGAEMEVEAARSILNRLGADLDGSLGEVLKDESRPGGLTEREVEVLVLVAAGHTNRQIADELFISHRTVARHLANIFTKLGVASRTEAARFVFDSGLARTG